MSYQLKLWDSKREKERINLQKDLPEAQPARLQNKRTEQYQRRASQQRTGQSPAGGRGEAGASQSQKEASSAPEMASPTKLQTGFQFLTKDFLRFWMVDICWEGRSQRSAPQKRHMVHRTSAPGN